MSINIQVVSHILQVVKTVSNPIYWMINLDDKSVREPSCSNDIFELVNGTLLFNNSWRNDKGRLEGVAQ
jgi:hypothetical protein